MTYEFKSTYIPPHKCTVLDLVPVSKTRTNHVCVVCKQVVSWWDFEENEREEREYPEYDNRYYSEALLEKLK